MSNLQLTNEMFRKWVLELRALPVRLRHEAIDKRWNDLTPGQRESIVYVQQMDEKMNKALHVRVHRPRAIGPVDRAMRQMEDSRRSRR